MIYVYIKVNGYTFRGSNSSSHFFSSFSMGKRYCNIPGVGIGIGVGISNTFKFYVKALCYRQGAVGQAFLYADVSCLIYHFHCVQSHIKSMC